MSQGNLFPTALPDHCTRRAPFHRRGAGSMCPESAGDGAIPQGEAGNRIDAATHSPPSDAQFDGATFDHERDQARLTGQLLGVFNHMRYGGWWTLRDLAGAVSGSEAGVSARIRDLRKARFGGHTVEARRRKGGLWEYRMEVR